MSKVLLLTARMSLQCDRVYQECGTGFFRGTSCSEAAVTLFNLKDLEDLLTSSQKAPDFMLEGLTRSKCCITNYLCRMKMGELYLLLEICFLSCSNLLGNYWSACADLTTETWLTEVSFVFPGCISHPTIQRTKRPECAWQHQVYHWQVGACLSELTQIENH